MSARPWFKFYPTDWKADSALGMCSLAARGLWIEMLCVMDEADPRGHLSVKGKPVTAKQMALLARCAAPEAVTLLAELEAAEVFSRTPDGVIFSRKMVRETRVSNDQRGRANKRWGADGDCDLFESGIAGSDAQSPESRVQSPDNQIPEASVRDALEAIWQETPPPGRKRSSRGDLEKALTAAANRRKNLATVRASLLAYYASPDCTKEGGRWAKGVHRMVEQDRWEDWAPEAVHDLAADLDFERRKWRSWMEDFIAKPYQWRHERGPQPDEPGCRIPLDIMLELGYAPPARAEA